MSELLTTAQKLGLAPLTEEQKKERECESINRRISDLISEHELPRWAYLDSEFQAYRTKLQQLLREKAHTKC